MIPIYSIQFTVGLYLHRCKGRIKLSNYGWEKIFIIKRSAINLVTHGRSFGYIYRIIMGRTSYSKWTQTLSMMFNRQMYLISWIIFWVASWIELHDTDSNHNDLKCKKTFHNCNRLDYYATRIHFGFWTLLKYYLANRI